MMLKNWENGLAETERVDYYRGMLEAELGKGIEKRSGSGSVQIPYI